MQACFVAIYPIYNRIIHDENSYTVDFSRVFVNKFFSLFFCSFYVLFRCFA